MFVNLCNFALVHRTLRFLPCFGIVVGDMETIWSGIAKFLPYIQIILSVFLVAAILLQQRGSSLGGAFGGDNFSATFHKRRGAELFLFRATIVLGVLFVTSAFLALVSNNG